MIVVVSRGGHRTGRPLNVRGVWRPMMNEGGLMPRVLLLGYDPETVDFSDPALPPGMTIETIRAGVAVALQQFTARGWQGEVGYIRPDETAGADGAAPVGFNNL